MLQKIETHGELLLQYLVFLLVHDMTSAACYFLRHSFGLTGVEAILVMHPTRCLRVIRFASNLPQGGTSPPSEELRVPEASSSSEARTLSSQARAQKRGKKAFAIGRCLDLFKTLRN